MSPIATLDELGRRIAQARDNAGLNQSEAARLYGVSPGTWSGMESGKQGDKFLDLIRICQVLKTTPNELLGFERPPSSEEAPDTAFEDDVIHAIEVVLTEFGMASAKDAFEIGKTVIEMAKKKTAPGVDRPSAVRSYTFDWMQGFLDRIKGR
jgi:transcriptional regulator with XRE-family HTH domain